MIGYKITPDEYLAIDHELGEVAGSAKKPYVVPIISAAEKRREGTVNDVYLVSDVAVLLQKRFKSGSRTKFGEHGCYFFGASQEVAEKGVRAVQRISGVKLTDRIIG